LYASTCRIDPAVKPCSRLLQAFSERERGAALICGNGFQR